MRQFIRPSDLAPSFSQDADAVAEKMDPVGLGLVSFSTFCQGVGTIMETNLHTASQRRTDGELNCELSHLHITCRNL